MCQFCTKSGLVRGNIIKINSLQDDVLLTTYGIRPGMRAIVLPHNEYFKGLEVPLHESNLEDKAIEANAGDGLQIFVTPSGQQVPVSLMDDEHLVLVWQNHMVTSINVLFRIVEGDVSKTPKVRWFVERTVTPQIVSGSSVTKSILASN